jgi:protein TonB
MGNPIVRWLIFVPFAAAITVGLFMLMKFLISGQFKLNAKEESISFEINPVVEDVQIVKRETKITKIKKVVTPPPPPQIERQQAAKPTEAIASIEGAIPEFEAPKIDRQNFKIQVSDRDAQPLVRIPPIMPPRAERSGHCKMRFDVSPEGQPFNVQAVSCSQSLFSRASSKSVTKWKYNPKIVDGRAVSRTGVETKITFRLADERGNIIPE